MPRISEEVIQEILSKTDIVDLIGETVTLSKKGKSYFGLCPFHQEKTPSFSVEPERKIYNCFSCGEKGNPITFLQKTQNMNFVEAVESLAERAHVEIDFSSYKQEHPNSKYFEINLEAKNFYHFYLSSTKQGQVAMEYLSNRGMTEDIIKEFQLGLAPTDFDILYKTLTEKGYLVSDLYDLGLVKQSKQESFYDLFRERIIFPIHDSSGNVVAFSGRVYQENDTTAKYINSPQTVVFTKSNVLYHLYQGLQAIKQTKRIVLFEGYMDVIAAVRAGIKESVASMGTSLTQEQVRVMKRYVNEVVICYDGDSAGLAATDRAIKLLQAEKINAKVVLLPEQLDPDDYIKKYTEKALADYINNNWIDSIEFAYIMRKSTMDFTKMLDVGQFKKSIFDLVKHSSNTIIESYIRRLSIDTKISLESIRQDFNQCTRKFIGKSQQRLSKKIPIDSKYENAERRLLLYFMEDSNYLHHFNQEFDEVFFIHPMARDIKYQIEDFHHRVFEGKQTGSLTEERLFEQLTEEQKQYFTKKVHNKNLELMEEEYHDLLETLQEYKKVLARLRDEEAIAKSESKEDKIKKAIERDAKIKEAKHGQR